jgi:hypothetical protein
MIKDSDALTEPRLTPGSKDAAASANGPGAAAIGEIPILGHYPAASSDPSVASSGEGKPVHNKERTQPV